MRSEVGRQPKQSNNTYRYPEAWWDLNRSNRGRPATYSMQVKTAAHTKRPPSVHGDLCSILVDNDNHNHVGAAAG
jgi:hypothetical protein